jgi:hypothetical protein
MRLHAIHQSSLYKIGSKKRLAATLKVDIKDLLLLGSLGQENYREWALPQKRSEQLAGLAKKGARLIQQPKILLATVQKRVAALLSRVEKPDYVYSATKRKTYLHNALVHAAAPLACKIDIKSFYTHVPQSAVRAFFQNDMRCSPDVARILAGICTVNGHLPTGGAASPLLSYFSCMGMFDSVALLCKEAKLNFSLYVDDMAFSGEKIPSSFISDVTSKLQRCGYKGHKIEYYGSGKTKVVTGVALASDGTVSLTNRRRKKMRLYERAFWACTNPDHMRVLGQALIGQYREAERIEPGCKLLASRIQDRINSMGPRVHPERPARKRSRRAPARSTFAALRERLATQSKAGV